MSTKFVIHPAGGLPPARTLITNFVLSLFSGLDMLYIYIIYIYVIFIYVRNTGLHLIAQVCSTGHPARIPEPNIYIDRPPLNLPGRKPFVLTVTENKVCF